MDISEVKERHADDGMGYSMEDDEAIDWLISEYERLTAANIDLTERVLYAEREMDEAKLDAERWRAVINCARVRVLGSAGLTDRRPNGYAHIGVELWTHHPESSYPQSVLALTQFADIAREAK